jgi:N-acetylglutamate synthase-like GNAT family acetyltransferase
VSLFEIKEGNLLLSNDKKRLDIEIIHNFLSNSYWSEGIPIETVEKGIANSMAFGLYKKDKQIGFCRIISDYTSFAYLADVFVLNEERGNGYAQWMIYGMKKNPELAGLRRWLLATKDAHALYKKTGWQLLENPDYFMEIVNKNIYKKNQE